MNRGQRTVASLLAVVAVLLGLNLIAKTSPAAVGQNYAGPTQPTVVAGHVQPVGADPWIYAIWRFWSDGTVDVSQRDLSHPQYTGMSSCDPVPNTVSTCGPVPILSGSCTADVTRNGEVEVGDLLNVLGQWGPCQ